MRWRDRICPGEDNPPPPDPASVDIMRAIDEMPPAWRRLAYEYGRNIVVAFYSESTVQGAAEDLEVWRDRRQEAIGRCDWGQELHLREKIINE
jgi:hypothetical protein